MRIRHDLIRVAVAALRFPNRILEGKSCGRRGRGRQRLQCEQNNRENNKKEGGN